MFFWGELKRRNVYKVGVAYAIVAWLIIQFAAITFPHLNLPSWAVTFLIVFLIIGFLIALLLAWAYEVTPEGIKRTKEVPLSESITHLTGKKLNYILAGLLVLAVALLIFDNYYLDRRVIKPESVPTETAQTPAIPEVVKTQKTIAVLPFDDLSPEKDQEYFVLGLSEEILNSLCQIPDLGVAGRTSSFSFEDSNKTIQEVASLLGVENILEGSVRKAGNALRITAQLVRASDGLHLWSKTYDRPLKDIFAVQEDIASAVADELKITLGIGKSLKQLGGTDNIEAYELYLAAKGIIRNNPQEYSQSLESLEAATAIDPDFALAWAYKAKIYWNRAINMPANLVASDYDSGQGAAQKAIAIEPNLGQAYLSLGAVHMVKGEFIEAELAYRKGMELSTDTVDFSDYGLGRHYSVVGNFERYYELLEAARRNDPLNKDIRANFLLSLGLRGEMEQAEEEYKRGKALFGDDWFLGDGYITTLRLRANDSMSSDEIISVPISVDVAKEYLNSPEKGLEKLKQIYSTGRNLSSGDLVILSVFAAYFEDPNFAMDAIEKGVRIEASGAFLLWIPAMREVRQLPRFKEFVRKIGLVDYWNQFGWPDICRPLGNDDFVCD